MHYILFLHMYGDVRTHYSSYIWINTAYRFINMSIPAYPHCFSFSIRGISQPSFPAGLPDFPNPNSQVSRTTVPMIISTISRRLVAWPRPATRCSALGTRGSTDRRIRTLCRHGLRHPWSWIWAWICGPAQHAMSWWGPDCWWLLSNHDIQHFFLCVAFQPWAIPKFLFWFDPYDLTCSWGGLCGVKPLKPDDFT